MSVRDLEPENVSETVISADHPCPVELQHLNALEGVRPRRGYDRVLGDLYLWMCV